MSALLNSADVGPHRRGHPLAVGTLGILLLVLAACGSQPGTSSNGTGPTGSNRIINLCNVLTTAEADQLTGGAKLTGSPESTNTGSGLALDCFYAATDQDPNIVVRIDITQGVSQQTFETNARAGQPSVHAVSGIGDEAFEHQGTVGSATNAYSASLFFRVGTGQVSILVNRRGAPVDLPTLEADARLAVNRLGSSFGAGTAAPSPTAAPLQGGPAQMTFSGGLVGAAAGIAQCSLTGGMYTMMATVRVSGQSGPTAVTVTYKGYSPAGSATYQVGVDPNLVVNAAGPADKWLTQKGGSITIHGDASTGGGNINAMLHDGGALQVTGTWSCAA